MNILVIGAGVIGLTTAIRLREAGHRVVVAAARRTPDITSSRAGAVFTPFRADFDPNVRRWTIDGYRAFERLATERPDSGVSMTAMREYMFTPQESDPWWAEAVQDFRRTPDVAKPYAAILAARVPRMPMRRYLTWLEQRFVGELGGSIVTREFATLDQAMTRTLDEADGPPHWVVNCSGLGARVLANDAAMTPMRGQILHVENDLGLRDALLEEGRERLSTYIFPFDDYIVLGGTYEPGEWAETTDAAALEAIVARCRALLRADGHPHWQELGRRRIRELAGLRPARQSGAAFEAVRFEIEQRAEWGATRVLHNYGHGRAGVTLSWGAAEDARRILSEG